jgi:predicted PurR-regulated permease PerM
VNELEGMPMTVGLAIGLVVVISAIVGFVWTIATIRSNDRTSISKEISEGLNAVHNAIDRMEKKVDDNHEQLHARANKQIEDMGNSREQYGYIKGVQETHEKFLLKLLDKNLK